VGVSTCQLLAAPLLRDSQQYGCAIIASASRLYHTNGTFTRLFRERSSGPCVGSLSLLLLAGFSKAPIEAWMTLRSLAGLLCLDNAMRERLTGRRGGRRCHGQQPRPAACTRLPACHRLATFYLDEPRPQLCSRAPPPCARWLCSSTASGAGSVGSTGTIAAARLQRRLTAAVHPGQPATRGAPTSQPVPCRGSDGGIGHRWQGMVHVLLLLDHSRPRFQHLLSHYSQSGSHTLH